MDTPNNESKGQWFVVNTLSGYENKVKDNIEKQLRLEGASHPIYEVLIPMEKVSEVRQGKKVTSTRKFFPGYILVRMDLYDKDGNIFDNTWYFVRQTQGVIGFVGGTGERPLPLSQREVDNLMSQVKEREENIIPKMQFETGETVRIKDGAFENFEGVIENIDPERGKLKILVSIFGRSTPVELEYWQIEKS